MAGRQIRGWLMSSHDRGNTAAKKIANVGVGKSTQAPFRPHANDPGPGVTSGTLRIAGSIGQAPTSSVMRRVTNWPTESSTRNTRGKWPVATGTP